MKDLTAREREVVTWVAAGLPNDEIATQLVVSAETVRTHVSRAMLKLKARDRAQLVVFAVQSGLGPRRGEAIHRRYEELLPARGSRQRKPGTTSSARVPPCQLLTNQGTTA